jgi:hypothetical protein
MPGHQRITSYQVQVEEATETKFSIGRPIVPDRPSPTRNDPQGSTTRQDQFTLINKRKERNDRRVARHNNSGSGNTDRGRGSQPFRRGKISQHDDTSSSDEEPDDLQRIVVDRRQNHDSSDSDADSDSDATTQSSRQGSKAIK